MQKKDMRVKVIHQQNAWVSVASNNRNSIIEVLECQLFLNFKKKDKESF